MKKNFLKSSLQNASFNIVFQILSRSLTFLMNAFVLRHISQAVIGVMNVRLLLLESTILFLSREAFRRACLSKTVDHNWVQVINLLWLTVPLCCTLCLFFGWIWLSVLETPSSSITPHYRIGVWAIAISCVIEMCVEPLYLVSQAFLFVKLRVVMDTICLLIRSVTFTTIVLWWPDGAVVAFSTAQIVAVIAYAVCYYCYFSHYIKQRKKNDASTVDDDFPFTSLSQFLPNLPSSGEQVVDWKLCILTWSFIKQGVLKQLLTEGERYIMTLFSILSFYEQGVFDVVNNLGSLAARFLFRPIEESAYFYFSQLVHRDIPISEQNVDQINEASTVLKQLLRTVVSIGLVVLAFGQAYTRLALLLYGGSKLAIGLAPMLLRTHCFAILFIAINGTAEGYVLATMDAKQLDRFNHWMAILSVGFLLVSWLFTTLFGSVGFILANCCNMIARITHSILFIKHQYKDTQFRPLDGIIPGKLFSVALITSFIITFLSEVYFYDKSKTTHFVIGAISFFTVVSVWIFEEKELFTIGIQKFRRHSLVSKEN
ncbi:man(5)GlcNAc(2)-PP-dolichol translocation protein RFT1 [Lycorma delicatula]|uniref:man(5)GlcNAc(2)-PP-dolichol translocation protein RFT1 n=1 Tax=Lycorma delicatula TaxID=130591 RepID=UPI003F519EDC